MTSIRARMTLGFAVFVALLMLSGCTVLMRQARRAAENRGRDLLSVAVAHTSHEANEPENRRDSLLRVVKASQGEFATGNLTLLIVDAQNRVLWRSRRHAPAWPPRSDEAARWRLKTWTRNGQTLVAALPWTSIAEDLHEDILRLWALGALLVGAASCGAWFLVGRTLSPIERLAVQAETVSTERLRARLQAPSPDAEIVRLVGTLNGLLDRLSLEARVRGRFYASASHELRTPLQALLGSLDVSLSRPRSAPEYERALQEAQSQTERLTVLVQDLLRLNQLETQPAPPCAPLNLADICERVLSSLQELAASRGIDICADLPDVDACAPSSHVEMLCRNLLENAVKYASPNSTVRVTLQPHSTPNGSATLEVFNACDLPPDTEVASWFEPFMRPDVSRAETGGNGLGLAIARAVADANGWTLHLERVGKIAPNGVMGVRVVVRFE